MPSAAKWIDLESVTLNEVSQTKKGNYGMASLIDRTQKEMIQINLLQNR